LSNVIFEAMRASRHDTRDAIAIMHPDNQFKVIFLPRSHVIACSKVSPNRHLIEVPDFIAKEHDL